MTLFVPFDVFLSVGMVATWGLLGLVDLRVAVVTVAIRMVLWFVHLRQLLGPVRAFQDQDRASSDATVLEADAALQSLARRSSIAFTASWLGTELLWIVMALVDVPVEVPSGDAELIAGLMFATTALGLSSLVRLLLDSALLDVRDKLGLAVLARGLDARRPQVSLTRPVVETAVWMLLGAVLVTGGAALVANARIQRDHAVSEQRQRAELSVARIAAGLGEAPDDVRIVEFDALPTRVAAAIETADERGLPSPELVAYHDIDLNLAIAAAPLGDGRYALSVAEPDERLQLLVGVLLVVAVVATPLFALAFSLFARMITAPIERFADAAQQFVDRGELQGLERIVPLRNDELGRLATSFNGMLDILEQLTGAAAAVSAGDLRVELEHPGELHDAFRGMLVRLNEIVGRMRETSLELASAAAEINALTQQQEQAALTQSSDIQQVAFTVSELATSAQQIADATKGVLHDAEQAVATTDATAEEIVQLRRHTTSITELLQVIGEIADRSDLLALNGSLEATRAGEAGRGFALVAAEMRRLAERVTGTVEDVRARVTDVDASSTSTVLATEDSRKLAQRTAAAARDISMVTATQSRGTEQASSGVQSVADMVVKATLAFTQTRAAAEGLRDHASELERLIASFEVRSDDSTMKRKTKTAMSGAGRDRVTSTPRS